MDMITLVKMNDYLCHQINHLDNLFRQEAIHQALGWKVPEEEFEWFIRQYVLGKYWIFLHQN